jgi:hypothetical protein
MGVVARARSLPPKRVASSVETAIEEKNVTDIKRLTSYVPTRVTSLTTKAPIVVVVGSDQEGQQRNRSGQLSVSSNYLL